MFSEHIRGVGMTVWRFSLTGIENDGNYIYWQVAKAVNRRWKIEVA